MRQKIKDYLNKKKISRGVVRWLGRLTAPYKWRIIGLVLLKCVLTAIGIFMAIVNKRIVDDASASLGIANSIIVAVCGTALTLAGNVILSVIYVRLTERYSFHIRSRMYEHILRSLWRSRTGYHSEELLSRLTSDVSAITGGVINSLVTVISTIAQLCMAFFVLWHYDQTLAVFALITGPVAAIASLAVGRRLKGIQEKLQQTEADYRVYLQEQICNADVVKAFQLEESSVRGLDELQEKRMRLIVKKNRWKVLLTAVISLVFSGSYLYAFINGAQKIADGTITYGTMTAFLSLIVQVQTPIYTLSSLLPHIIGVLASAGRVKEIADFREEPDIDTEKVLPVTETVSLRAEELCFAYGGEPVLTDFSLTIKAGETAVIMGPSGIGKTTLVRLLLGFMSPDSGKLCILDDKGRETVCGGATRQYISYVPQGNTLFSGTIAENLRCGNPDATEEEMRSALEAACALEFVQALPDGLETVLGEKARGLSEGQAQRIAIARAMIRPAPLLLLDEATSALDEETERRILENLRYRKKGQSCLVITHRSAVRKYADKIIELTRTKPGI